MLRLNSARSRHAAHVLEIIVGNCFDVWLGLRPDSREGPRPLGVLTRSKSVISPRRSWSLPIARRSLAPDNERPQPVCARVAAASDSA